ncbi:hypothetical protein Tco_0664194 [Tanacetum coccineum]
MASLDHRLNPLFSIKECSSCGALYTADFCCSKGGLEDKILVPKPPQNCATCGDPVDGLYCRPCAFVRKCLNEGWYTIHDKNEILNTSESSNHNTNVVSAPQEPFVFNQDPGVNSSQSPLQINHNCCYKCGDSLDDIFCQRCTCKSCGNGAHIGYNCPPKAPIISNPEQCNQTINELPQTLPSVHPTCNSGDENSFTYDSKPNFVFIVLLEMEHKSIFQLRTLLTILQILQITLHNPSTRQIFTSKEILQAQNDLMEAIQAFLKEYDHIPPNEKCMALLLAEERLLKIKQTMEEEQNQREVMQDMLLKLMDDLQILKGSQQEKKETAAQSFTPYQNFSMIDDEEARDNFLKDVCTFLRKFSCIPFGLTPKVILIAWESFGKIKDALADKQYQQEDIQELMSKLLKDVKPTEITPDLLIEEPDNSLIMGDEHLDTIPSVENLVPILSESEGISDDTCDVPVCDDSSTFDALINHSEILSDSKNDDTSSDDDSYENIEYVEASPLNLEYDSLEEVNEDQEENEFDLEDIFQIQDVILREKLVNISRLITNIESLKNNPTPDHVFKSSFSFPIPVTDSDSFFEESDTSLSHLDNSLPKFETFSDHTEETRSGRGLISIVIFDNSNDPLLELPEFESFHFDLYDDPSFPRPPPEPPDVEISFIVETDAPVMNNFDELNGDECFDPGGDKIDVEDDDSFIFVIRTFLPFLTYPADSPFLYSFGSEDTIFDPGIST